ncbi:MAG: guanylate kinase [Chloroflexota bacterium]
MTDEAARQGLLIVLSGPSGVGKDTVIVRLKEKHVSLHYTVTVTTRAKRCGEVHGVNYFFVTPDEFARLRREGELLESAVVHGNNYGTPRGQVREALAAGKDVLLKVDVQGAAQIKERVPDAVFIFLAPPSLNELFERLKARGTESEPELTLRFGNAHREMADLGRYDYVVVNHRDCLDETVEKVASIITAEHCRVKPRHVEV